MRHIQQGHYSAQVSLTSKTVDVTKSIGYERSQFSYQAALK